MIRNFELILEQRLRERLNFMQIVVGPRQVGKTTGVERIFMAWSGAKKFVSADLPTPPDHSWLELQWNEALQLEKEALLIIDEVQKVPRWSDVIKPLFDKIRASRNLKVVLLGSASLTLQRGLHESLAGRFELINAPHWSFAECKQKFNIDFSTYLEFGGYPAALELRNGFERWQNYIRNSIIEPVLGRDIQSAARINKPPLFRQTFELAMAFPAQVISYQKLLGQLQESGNTETVKYYLELLEGAFLLKQLAKFSQGAVTVKSSSPKLLPLDLALVGAFTRAKRAREEPSWRGFLVEAAFGAHLARMPGDLFYWSEGRNDVDFVHSYQGKIVAYEIKSGRERDSKGLAAFQKKYPHAHIKLISTEEIEEVLLKNQSTI
jgi:hypothetical protein